MKRAIIFVNGNLSDISQAKKIIKKKDYLIAVDGGTKHILELGLIPNVIVGDFDSISSLLLKKLTKICREQKSLFPTMIKYPTKKNATDFELVINYCLGKKFTEIIIFGILGDRIDHMIANIFLIAKIQTQNQSASRRIKIKIFEGKKEIFILNKEISINGKVGDEISIIPVSEKLEGITTNGLYYRLIDDTFLFGTTRGISNVMKQTQIKISVKKGVALVEHNY
ncbi:MAG: thiamine diphosphokinase [Candidatus Roizmanbacteria bacterium]|nr:thiamine diphosphokinase [Candidatus Roizmanbacteria bacterium]MCR4312693.1 thiamine diphosphokinase [Candidatus Roizmanbacteria bacterium]